MTRMLTTLAAFPILLLGCATGSQGITPEYVSPMQYQPYDCEQLISEMQRIQVRVTQLGGRLDQASAHDKAIGVAGAVLFWPALFALGGNEQQEAEYARMKGEYEAIQQAAIMKRCPGAVTYSDARGSHGPSRPPASAQGRH